MGGCQGQRSKKHVLWFFHFHDICRKNMVLVGFKGQKNIFYIRVEYRKNTDCSSSKVMDRVSETMSIGVSRCYTFAQDHIDWTNQIEGPLNWPIRLRHPKIWPIRYFCALTFVQSDFFTSGVQPNRCFCPLILRQSDDFTIGLVFNQVFQAASSANQVFFWRRGLLMSALDAGWSTGQVSRGRNIK